jgi:bacterioferritin-associated ferredoxin
VYVCVCHAVTEREVVAAVLEDGADSVAAVGELTFAGTGCGSCHARIEGVLGACGAVCPIGDRRELRSPALAS